MSLWEGSPILTGRRNTRERLVYSDPNSMGLNHTLDLVDCIRFYLPEGSDGDRALDQLMLRYEEYHKRAVDGITHEDFMRIVRERRSRAKAARYL